MQTCSSAHRKLTLSSPVSTLYGQPAAIVSIPLSVVVSRFCEQLLLFSLSFLHNSAISFSTPCVTHCDYAIVPFIRRGLMFHTCCRDKSRCSHYEPCSELDTRVALVSHHSQPASASVPSYRQSLPVWLMRCASWSTPQRPTATRGY